MCTRLGERHLILDPGGEETARTALRKLGYPWGRRRADAERARPLGGCSRRVDTLAGCGCGSPSRTSWRSPPGATRSASSSRCLNAQKVPGDPNDAGLLMDWKFGYADGALDIWTVADVSEFLFGWCPRKLSAEPEDCAEIPVSVAAFVEFLAHTGLLARGSDLPSQVRCYCERNTARFVREMGNPANFGMAKSLLAPVAIQDSTGDGAPDALTALIRTVEGLPPGVADIILEELTADDGEDDSPVIGPVRLPEDRERCEAIRAARVPRQLRMLADYCAPPGRPLTGKGNLRVADARHLVAALDTGDDPELGGYRKLQSAEDLPSLHRLVRLALEAGVVRRQQGKLVTVARFTGLNEVTAYEKVVRAAITAGLSGPPGVYFPAMEPVRAVVDECVIGLLADLLDAGSVGIPARVLVDSMAEFVEASFHELPDLVIGLIPGWVRAQLERLEDLGVVTTAGDKVTLTSAGVPVSIGLVEDAGVEVLLRPDPAICGAHAIVDLLGVLEDQEWTTDASAWLAARPDPVAAAGGLVDEICAKGRDPVAVVAGLNAVTDVAGEEAVAAARRQLGGPHDGLVLYWLAEKSAIDPSTVDPTRFVAGLVDVLALALDTGGPREMVDTFNDGEQDQQIDLLSGIWRLDHPRLPDVLEVVGAQHPVKAVAKAARKALVQHRSRMASAGER
jgi:hypothetical protein